MDASKITELLQKQNTRYINRNQTVDASTLIWKNQIQSSKYIKGVKTCEGVQNCNVPTNPCCADQATVNGQVLNTGIYSFGGAGRTTAIQSGSPQQFLSVFAGASGSASQVYSSEIILLQRAGKEACGVSSTTTPAPQNTYVVLPSGGNVADPATLNSYSTINAELRVPSCSYICTNTNGPADTNPVVTGNSAITGNPNNLPVNNQSNPYLPPFDTYYRFKNPQCNQPVQDQNQKYFVKQCHSRFPNANNGVNAVFSPENNVTEMNPVTCVFYTSPVINPTTEDGTILTPDNDPPYFISYNIPSCVGIDDIYEVIFGPGTPQNGTFTISGGTNAPTINSVTGTITISGTTASGNYTVFYTIGSVIITTIISIAFC